MKVSLDVKHYIMEKLKAAGISTSSTERNGFGLFAVRQIYGNERAAL